MEFAWTREDTAFRRELAAFLDLALQDTQTDRLARTPSRIPDERPFVRMLAERGWLTPHWPEEHGGRGMGPWQHVILNEELWLRGEPRGPQYMNVNWIAPTIMAAGTRYQQEEHLGPIARGEVRWCQGFSEPEAGSDLASLRTSAVRDGDYYVVNGQKTWTSYASIADYCYLLVRTEASNNPRDGITILLVPMTTPGIEVREIDSIVGPHAMHDVYFTDVRVPVSARLGDEHQGWNVVRAGLAYERCGSPRYARAAYALDCLADWCDERGLLDDPGAQQRLAAAHSFCEAARLLTYRAIDDRAKDRPSGARADMARTAMVRAEREVARAAMDLMGPAAMEENSVGHSVHVMALTAGIVSGSYEIQFNRIARLQLELPGA